MSSNPPSGSPGSAWIDGAPASLAAAVAEAASLLGGSRQALLAGLGTDIEGLRAAVLLAERIGGVIDHTHSAAMLRDLDSMRETGVMLMSPGEAHVRADTVLLVGDGLDEAWPELCQRILNSPARPTGADVQRRIVWLAPTPKSRLAGFDGALELLAVGRGAKRAAALAALRARVRRRPVAQPPVPLARLDAAAEILRAARFGVAVWSAASLDALEIEALNGLARDLNETTRFSTLPLAAPDNGPGVLAACGWTTGFPMRTGFAAIGPVHDPWRFDAERLVAAGETDCAVWISAFGAMAPTWSELPVIAISDAASRFPKEPKVRIVVGRPGLDHDAVLHNADTGALVAIPAAAPSDAPSVAQALGMIASRLADEKAPS